MYVNHACSPADQGGQLKHAASNRGRSCAGAEVQACMKHRRLFLCQVTEKSCSMSRVLTVILGRSSRMRLPVGLRSMRCRRAQNAALPAHAASSISSCDGTAQATCDVLKGTSFDTLVTDACFTCCFTQGCNEVCPLGTAQHKDS